MAEYLLLANALLLRVPDLWDTLFMVFGLFISATMTIRGRKETSLVHEPTEATNARTQAIKFNPSCSGQTPNPF